MRDIKCSPEAREKCPFDHPCHNEDMAWFEEGSPCDKFNKSLIPSPPPTNADHIRSMADEELAKFLLALNYDGWPFACINANECDPAPEDPSCCDECFKKWLKQPYKEDTHD